MHMTITDDFSALGLSEQMLTAVRAKGFETPTAIQKLTIPHLLTKTNDIIAQSQTGTGKTAAYGLPILQSLEPARGPVQAIILVPTRELALQAAEELLSYNREKRLSITAIYGGAAMSEQLRRLAKGADIVVGTPGRVLDHIRRGTLKLDKVRFLVLDEADEMLNMGFYKDVRKILDQIKSRQRLAMFSATISREVMDIGWLYQRDAEEITVQPVEDSAPRIDQYLVLTTGRNKLADMAEIIVQKGYKRVMVFCNQKYTTAMLANQMARLNFVVDCLHGDLSQAERNKIMGEFKAGNIAVLVATDVAARGIDVSEVDAVFNYDVPDSNEYYTHRIGRTGRAKHTGEAYVLYTKEEHKRVRDMLRYTRNTATPIAFDENRSIIPGAF